MAPVTVSALLQSRMIEVMVALFALSQMYQEIVTCGRFLVKEGQRIAPLG